jgi:hypothetical protein
MLYCGENRRATGGVRKGVWLVPRWHLWAWVVAGALLTFGGLFIGRHLYRQQVASQPLVSAAEHIDGVRRAAVVGPSTLAVWMGPNASLARVYPAALRAAQHVLGPTARVELVDNPTSAEQTLNATLAFVVAQTEAQGTYAALPGQAEALARQHHARATVQLGSSDLFITLWMGPHRLDAVYPLNWIAGTPGRGDSGV